MSSLSQALLIQTAEQREIAEVVERRLPLLPVQSCFLSLYEEEKGWSRLLVGYDERGAVAKDDLDTRFPTKELAPPGLLDRGRPLTAIIEPLFFRERQIGLALFEIDPREGALCEELRGQLSAALERSHREGGDRTPLRRRDRRRALEFERAQQVERRRKGLRYVLDSTAELHRIQPLNDMLTGLLGRVGGLLAAVGSVADGSRRRVRRADGRKSRSS